MSPDNRPKGDALSQELYRWLQHLYAGIEGVEFECRFHPLRRWRFDLCWPAIKVAVECHGDIWKGRHTRPLGFAKDREKMNAAQLAGWLVLEFSTEDIRERTYDTCVIIARALRLRGQATVHPISE